MMLDTRRGAVASWARLSALVLGFACLSAGSQTVPNSVVASGGGTVSAGPYRLTSSMGEPVAGPTQNGGTRITAGFLATFVSGAGGRPDALFSNGFE
jgi:hypothetical protein